MSPRLSTKHVFHLLPFENALMCGRKCLLPATCRPDSQQKLCVSFVSVGEHLDVWLQAPSSRQVSPRVSKKHTCLICFCLRTPDVWLQTHFSHPSLSKSPDVRVGCPRHVYGCINVSGYIQMYARSSETCSFQPLQKCTYKPRHIFRK